MAFIVYVGAVPRVTGGRARTTGMPLTRVGLQETSTLIQNFEVQCSTCYLHFFKHQRVDNHFLPPQLVLDSEGPNPAIRAESRRRPMARHSPFPSTFDLHGRLPRPSSPSLLWGGAAHEGHISLALVSRMNRCAPINWNEVPHRLTRFFSSFRGSRIQIQRDTALPMAH